MQVNFNSNYKAAQSFGSVNVNNCARTIIAMRANSPQKYMKAESILSSMNKSKIYTEILKAPKSKNRLLARLSDDEGRHLYIKESVLSSLISSPVKFLNKVREAVMIMEKQ